MSVVTIVAASDDRGTFVAEMATDLGSLVIYVIVPETDHSRRKMSHEKRVAIAWLRARTMAMDLLTNTPTGDPFLN